MRSRCVAAVALLALCGAGCVSDGRRSAPAQTADAPMNVTSPFSPWVGLWTDASGSRVRVGADGRFNAELLDEKRFGEILWTDTHRAEGDIPPGVRRGEQSDFTHAGERVVFTNAPNGATEFPTLHYTLTLRLDAGSLVAEYREGERVKQYRLARADRQAMRAAFEQVLGRVPAAPVEPGYER